MKLRSLYISPLELNSGSSTVSFGIMEILKRHYKTVAFFRPIIKTFPNSVINLIVEHYDLKIDTDEAVGVSVDQAEEFISNNQTNKLYELLIKKYEQLQQKYDFVLMQGVSRDALSSTIDFDINLQIAKNLDTAVIGVLNSSGKSNKQLQEDIKIEHQRIIKEKCNHFATFVNKVNSSNLKTLKNQCKELDYQIYFLPEIKELCYITLDDVKSELDAKLIFGENKNLAKSITGVKIAAMGFDNFINYIQDGDFIITPCDRTDIIIGSIAAVHSKTVPSISGILLTGQMQLDPQIHQLISGFKHLIPIIKVDTDTYTAAKKISNIKSVIKASNKHKTSLISGLFYNHVDYLQIENSLNTERSNILTPIMFEYQLLKKMSQIKKTIVLAEPLDERVLQASEVLLNIEAVNLILIGSYDKITKKASLMGVDISKAVIIDPFKYEHTESIINQYLNLRQHKGLRRECAKDTILTNHNYFATMLVYLGYADGMVSGNISTTANTVRPALQIVKTKSEVKTVSSVFLMCMETQVLVFGDCAINLNPTSDELADIAISSASTAKEFGIDPKVAMLSYSTGESGSGKDVQKVRDAMIKAKEKSNITIDGPIQFDAAIDPSVANKKLPDSNVAGRATVFIFPDLNTGNNTYKAVQRSSGAVAIGPILQGLNKPINDLSRGCTVKDIINTIAITAIQAQGRQV